MSLNSVTFLKEYMSLPDYKLFRSLFVRGGTNVYYLLKLPDGRHAALWNQIIPRTAQIIATAVRNKIRIERSTQETPIHEFIEGMSIHETREEAVNFIQHQTYLFLSGRNSRF
jgi:hypothetical protein